MSRYLIQFMQAAEQPYGAISNGGGLMTCSSDYGWLLTCHAVCSSTYVLQSELQSKQREADLAYYAE